jgi:predicted amidohydrolase
MKTGFYQFDVIPGDKARNLERISAALSAAEFDLLVLPELCTTGYLFSSRQELQSLAEPVPGGQTTSLLASIARKKRAYVVAGLAESDGDCLYNTAVLVGPGGYLGRHRKIHLPQLEQPLFERGHELQVFDLGGVQVGVVLCFESWFPEQSRRLSRQGAQILCNPANFGGPWSLDIMRTRALENVVYTITANRIGEEENAEITAHFRGQSQVIAYDGAALLRVGRQEILATVEIDPSEAQDKICVVGTDVFQELAYCDAYADPG